MNKKAISAVSFLMIPFLLGTLSIRPRQAQAVIVAVSGGSAVPSLIVLGAGLSVGILGTYAAIRLAEPEADAGINPFAVIALTLLTGTATVLTGVILLDAEHPERFAFSPLTVLAASQLGLIESERTSFNDELPEINAIAQSVGQDLRTSEKTSAQLAAERWTAYAEGELSPPTLSALKKISTRYAEELDRLAARHGTDKNEGAPI